MFSNQATFFGQNRDTNLLVSAKSVHRLLVSSILLLALTACQSYKLEQEWPPQIPDRELFIAGYLEKRNLDSATESEIAYHLGWVKKFYQGTTLYPNGWLRASSRYIESINDPKIRSDVSERMMYLGVQIANEWAQENGVRKINSTNIASWGSAMKTAAIRGEQLDFLDKVEKDVQSLINSKILSNDIGYDRYFVEESFDDF